MNHIFQLLVSTMRWLKIHISLVHLFYRSLIRIHELKDLARWAKRKRFDGPEKHYRGLLAQELATYQHYGQQHHTTALLTTYLYKFIQRIKPEPTYHKGWATKYRTATS